MRFLAPLLLSFALAPSVLAEDVAETPIEVPSPIPAGFLVAWKPSILSVRMASGQGSQFGSDKLQPLRMLGRYTTNVFDERFMFRAELEGGRFETDTQGVRLGTDGYDATVRLLVGTSTRIRPDLTFTAAFGLLTRYQRGRAVGGAPELGVLGVTSNAEMAYRLGPILTVAAFVEGGLAPIPYATQHDLGVLSDASELKGRLQLSVDVTPRFAVDLGYDFTRWHMSFSGSPVLDNAGDRALLVESRDHALTLGLRFKP